jgi:hypothetical protein
MGTKCQQSLTEIDSEGINSAVLTIQSLRNSLALRWREAESNRLFECSAAACGCFRRGNRRRIDSHCQCAQSRRPIHSAGLLSG